MNFSVINLYQQWAHGQPVTGIYNRYILFLNMASRLYGLSKEEIDLEIREYLKYSNFSEFG